jgi:cytochrome P450
MQRMVLKPFTFSNGHIVPAGTILSAPLVSMHRDSTYHANADQFEPWRFFDMRQKDGDGHKNQLASTSSEYLAFGYGKHAW